jgi:hypothetical protein
MGASVLSRWCSLLIGGVDERATMVVLKRSRHGGGGGGEGVPAWQWRRWGPGGGNVGGKQNFVK